MLVLTSCTAAGTSTPFDWSRASSASDGGGVQPLVKAAQREGSLVLPGPASAWDIGLRSAFTAAYGIRISSGPTVDDPTELAGAPLDVYELGLDSAATGTARFAPYLPFYWLEIPAVLKAPKAYWLQSCGGYVGLAYAQGVPPVDSVSGLTQPAYKVGLPGALADRNELIADVMAMSLASGSSADDPAPGVDYFGLIATAGTLVRPIDSDAPVQIGWNYALTKGYARFPLTRTVMAYQVEAVNRQAPHPAAARLWEEFVFSDTGQNTCMRYGARPARFDAMRADGVLDLRSASALDPIPAGAVTLTAVQMAAARAYVAAHWSEATGS